MATGGTGRSAHRPPPTRSEERRGWSTRDILRTLAIVAAFYITLQLLWIGRSVVLLAFLGVLFGLALTAAVDWLERRRVPRAIAAVLIVLSFLGLLVGIGAATAPSIASQMDELKTQLPQAIQKIQGWISERQQGVTEVLDQVAPAGEQPPDAKESGQVEETEDKPASLGRSLVEQIGGIGKHVFGIFSSTLAILGGMLLIIFIAVFVAVEPQTYHAGLMHLFPHEMRARAGEVLTATAAMLRRWLLAQMVGMLVIGLLTTGVLFLLGIKSAIALGIIAGILEFVPIVGPILAAVPAVAMGFLDSPEKALYVVLAYTAIQQVESNLLYPILMKKGLELPPVLTITAQGILAIVFGLIGLLVAVPLLAVIIVPIKMLYVRDVVGDEVTLPVEGEAE
jgi:predicted PurR-regulated permease PerM